MWTQHALQVREDMRAMARRMRADHRRQSMQWESGNTLPTPRAMASSPLCTAPLSTPTLSAIVSWTVSQNRMESPQIDLRRFHSVLLAKEQACLGTVWKMACDRAMRGGVDGDVLGRHALHAQDGDTRGGRRPPRPRETLHIGACHMSQLFFFFCSRTFLFHVHAKCPTGQQGRGRPKVAEAD
jgi:hypothetical protein